MFYCSKIKKSLVRFVEKVRKKIEDVKDLHPYSKEYVSIQGFKHELKSLFLNLRRVSSEY